MSSDKGLDVLNKREATKIQHLLKTESSSFWTDEGIKRSIALFKDAAKRVPAYKDFLQKHKINPDKINKLSDFLQLPLINKENYLKKYPLEKLCWDGHLQKTAIFTSTSGSSGEPFYFPRQHDLDWQYSLILESFLKDSGIAVSSGPILVINCFGMGVWIGGLMTYQAFVLAALREDLPVSIISPGVNKKEIFNALKKLAPFFEETILVGYPPFIKDIVDEAKQEKIELNKLNLRLIFAAEAITEELRDYLSKTASIKNIYLDTLNIYGSADIGAMAFETKMSILIKRSARINEVLFNDLFSQNLKTPTLAQYNPLFINFESVDGSIVLTGDNILPLIRYSIGDHGGVFNFEEMENILKKHNIDILAEASKKGIKNYSKLPFVYVYERSDFSTTLYGLQIYPEMIKEIVIGDFFSKYLTGKFTLLTKFNKNSDQYIEVNLELAKGASEPPVSTYNQLLKMILDNLKKKSSEFRELTNHINKRELMELVFWAAESSPYFKPGIKQKWVSK